MNSSALNSAVIPFVPEGIFAGPKGSGGIPAKKGGSKKGGAKKGGSKKGGAKKGGSKKGGAKKR